MYNVSATYLEKVVEPSRFIMAKVDIGGVILDETIISSFEVESSLGSDRMPTIGSSIASKLKLSLVKDDSIPAILINVPIKPYVGVETSTEVVEWIPLGVFYANVGDVIRNKRTIDIDCFDRMPDLDTLEYTSNLTFPATIQQMISEIETQHSIVFDTQTLPTVSFDTKPEGNVRQVITYIASLISRNVVVNRTGKFEFRFINTIAPATFTFSGDSYIDFSLLSDSMVKISQLSVTGSEGEPIVSGDATGISLVFENPAITSQAILDTVLARAYPLTFNAYTMTCQGFPHIDCGDSLQFTDVDGVVRTIIIAEHNLRYSGGLKSEFKCEAPKEESKDVTITSGSAIKHAVKNFAKTFEGAVKNATDLITGNEGGDLIILSDENGKPYELVILGDTPAGQVGDIDTAMKVWRWNAGGLGYSSTGYNGSYSTAITSDGQINADFIITGEMSASLVRTGLLSSEDGKTWIDLDTGYFKLGGITSNADGFFIGSEIEDAIAEEVGKVGLYKVDIISSNGLVFKNGVVSTTLIARVYKNSEDVTDTINSARFKWTKTKADGTPDTAWNTSYVGGHKQVTLTSEDIFQRASFKCEIMED